MGQHAGMLEIIIAMLVINLPLFFNGYGAKPKAGIKRVTFFDRLLISYGITDEIFAVAIGQKKKLQTSFMLGLIFISALGWAAGTFSGAAASQLLPGCYKQCSYDCALCDVYAIIIPPAKKEKECRTTCLYPLLCRLCFTTHPY